jgi:putative ABC transport system ATP-binding protein
MTSKIVLQTVNITKQYKIGDTNIDALKGVSIDIFENDFVSIIGKSGSGKSTLMHIMGLLDTPTSGEVILNGEDVSRLSEAKLAGVRNRGIGFVFQAFNLMSRATALENVILPLTYSKVPATEWRKKAEDMLRLVELGDRMFNKSNELSGGQKQRVAIARALVTNPAIILADEPTGNLDSRIGDEIFDLFVKLHKQGKTIVIVTHDDDIAEKTDRKIVIRDGVVLK